MKKATCYADLRDKGFFNSCRMMENAIADADLSNVCAKASGWIDGVLSAEHLFYCGNWRFWTLRNIEDMEKAFNADRLLADSEEALDEIDLILSTIHVLLPVWREVLGE